MALIVSTERLGIPGDDASWSERKGYVQGSPSYPNQAETPTATCHLQEALEVNALCGYQWEMLLPVPRVSSLAEVGRPSMHEVSEPGRRHLSQRAPERRVGGTYRHIRACG